MYANKVNIEIRKGTKVLYQTRKTLSDSKQSSALTLFPLIATTLELLLKLDVQN